MRSIRNVVVVELRKSGPPEGEPEFDVSTLRKGMKADLICQPRRYVEHFTRNSGSSPLPSWQLSADR